MKKRFIAAVLALLMVASSMPLAEFSEAVPDIFSFSASAKENTVTVNGFEIKYSEYTEQDLYDKEIKHTYLKVTVPPQFFAQESNTSITIDTTEIANALSGKSTHEGVILDCQFSKDKYMKDIVHVTFSENDYFVDALGQNMFSGCKNLHTVTLNSHIFKICNSAFSGCSYFVGSNDNTDNIMNLKYIRSIGTGAFNGCTTLAGVTLTNRLRSISDNAFTKCTKMTSVDIPKSVDYIGKSAFSGNSSMTAVNFEDGSELAYLGDSAFSSCTELKNVNVGETENILPSRLGEVGQGLFAGCTSLQKFTINRALTYTSEKMFSNCTNLKTVQFESSSKCHHVGISSFENCKALNEIELPDSVTGIANAAFKGCENLSKCILPNGIAFLSAYKNSKYKSMLETPDEKPFIDIYQYDPAENYDGDRGGSAFEGCKVLSLAQKSKADQLASNQIIIPTGVGYIPIKTFASCTGITNVTMPGVSDIGDSGFTGCTALVEVTVPDAVKRLRQSLFENCTKLSNVVYSKELLVIENNVFNGCSLLSSVSPSDVEPLDSTVIFPKTLGAAMNNSFSKCSNFKYLNILGGDDSAFALIGESAFSNCTSLEGSTLDGTTSQELKFPPKVVVIEQTVFNNCTKLEKIRFEGNVTSIGDRAFFNCSELTNITMNPTVTQIGNSAFQSCSKLLDVPLTPEGTSALVQLENIKNNTFASCISLTKVDLTEAKGISSIGTSAFSGCVSLETVLVPEDGQLDAIGNGAFSGCTSLELFAPSEDSEKSSIPDTVSSIGANAFSKTALKDIVIVKPANAEKYNVIGDSAFANCTQLCTADLSEANLTTLPKNVFSGDRSLAEVLLPDTVTTISAGAFSDCVTLSSINGTQKGESNIPNKVKTIGTGAFSNNHCISVVNLPASADIIDTKAWATSVHYKPEDIESGAVDPLKAFNVDENNSNYMSIDGVLYTKDGKTLILYPCRKEGEDFAIPDTVEEIAENAFTYNDLLQHVTINEGLKKLGSSFVNGCSSLRSMTFGKNTTVKFGSLSGVSSDPKLVFYAAEASTAQAYADKNKSTFTFVDNDMIAETLIITEGESISAVKDTGSFKLHTELYNKKGEPTTDVLTWKSSDLDVVTVDNNGTVSPKGDGTATLTVRTANGLTAEIEVLIGNKDITDDSITVTVEPESMSYTGSALKPKITVKDMIKTLTENKQYKVTYENNVNIGEATVTIEGLGSYTGKSVHHFTILGLSIKDTVITPEKDSYVYTGAPIKPTVTVTDGKKVLTEGTDYELVLNKNTNIGFADLSVVGKGNYGDSVDMTFVITPRSIKDVKVTVTEDNIVYDGKAKNPDIVLSYGDVVLTKGTDYSVSFTDNIDAGTATVTVKGFGNFYDETTASFEIQPKSVKELSAKLSQTTYGYDGTEKTPSVTVKDGKKTLKENEDYTLSYSDNPEAGTATVTVSGKGNYGDTLSLNFTISGESLEAAVVELENDSFDYDGTEKTPAVTSVKLGDKELTEYTDFEVSYENNIDAGKAYVVITGINNYGGIVRKEFTIKGSSISGATATLSQTEYTYDGEEKKPSVTVTLDGEDLVEHTDYSVSYKNNTDPGTATVTVKGIGNRSGSITLNFSISRQIIRLSGSGRYATAAAISEGTYPEKAETVVLANGRKFADALSGATLAKAYNAPILLTEANSLPADTLAEIKRLGAKNVIILGGSGSVGQQVKDTLDQNELTYKVVKGSSRFATAVEIAKETKTHTGNTPTEIFFVSSEKAADALSISGIAASKGAPIIYLPKTGNIDADTAAYLKSVKGKIKNAYVIGGSGMISADVMAAAGKALGLTVDKNIVRVRGSNKYETCVAVNTKFADAFDGNAICVATGEDFPDALAGGVFAAVKLAPMFLVNGKQSISAFTDSQKEYLKGSTAKTFFVFGGKGAVNDALVEDMAK